MFIFFFDSKEKRNQKKNLPPSISAIPNSYLPATIFNCVNNGGRFTARRLMTNNYHFNIKDADKTMHNSKIESRQRLDKPDGVPSVRRAVRFAD